MLAGILVGGLSLFLSRKRVRRAASSCDGGGGNRRAQLCPAYYRWFARGENAQALTQLTGAPMSWSAVVAQPRTEVNTLLGYGMSNDGFNGIPSIPAGCRPIRIKVLWVMSLRVVLVSLLIVALISPRGPGRAVALFLDRLLAVASFTETGLGQPSTYLLDLAVAMSLLMPPLLSTSKSETVTTIGAQFPRR